MVRLSRYVNLTSADSDGDGISDGQELYGYNVTIVWVEGEETISEDKKVFGDPLYAYKDQSDNWLDVDEDGIPDYIEADPVNITQQQNATVYQYVLTHNETCIEKQFNPLMRENIPPMIEDMSVKSKEKWGWCGIIPCVTHSWTEIRVRIFDVSSYTVEIKVLDNGKYETFSGWGNRTFNAFIDIDYWSDILLDYKVRVTAVDEAGNELVMEKEIEGFFGGVLEFLADIWDAIVGEVMAAWEAVVATLNFLLELIMAFFMSVLQPLIDAIQAAINELANTALSAVKQGFPWLFDDGEDPPTPWQWIHDAATSGSLFVGLVALCVGLNVAGLLSVAWTGGLGSILKLVSQDLFTFIAKVLVAGLVGTAVFLTIELIWNAIFSAVPESDSFWTTELGLAVADIISSGWKLIEVHHKVQIKKTYGKGLARSERKLDAIYFALSAAGLFLTIYSLTAEGTAAILTSVIGLLLTVVGAVLVYKGKDLFDLTKNFNPFSEFEEVVTLVVFVPMAMMNVALTLIREA